MEVHNPTDPVASLSDKSGDLEIKGTRDEAVLWDSQQRYVEFLFL
jgi:hypothetical protein